MGTHRWFSWNWHRDVWSYLLSGQWMRVSENDPFLGKWAAIRCSRRASCNSWQRRAQPFAKQGQADEVPDHRLDSIGVGRA